MYIILGYYINMSFRSTRRFLLLSWTLPLFNLTDRSSLRCQQLLQRDRPPTINSCSSDYKDYIYVHIYIYIYIYIHTVSYVL